MRRSHSTELVSFPWAETQTSFLDTLPGCQENDVQVGALSFKKKQQLSLSWKISNSYKSRIVY